MWSANLYRNKNSINGGTLLEILSSHIYNNISFIFCAKVDGEIGAAEYFFQKPTSKKCFL